MWLVIGHSDLEILLYILKVKSSLYEIQFNLIFMFQGIIIFG